MASRVLAATSSPYSRAAFAAVGGAIVIWGMINAVSAVGAMNAGLQPPAPAPVVTPVTAPEPPPPPPPAFVFDAPLPGHVVNSPFGLRQMPWEENGRLHEGVDIAAPAGAPVHVATDGVIMRSGVSSTYGRFVEVGHKDGFHTFYAHLGRDAGLKRGTFVKRGTTVAYVGSSGRSTGSHLHFELRNKAGKPLNPALFMGKTFAEKDDLPLKAAARVGRKVRLAQVSRWPEGVKAPGKMAANGEGGVTRVKGGRVRVRINVVDG
ncbi:peptidase M24 [Caulobacter sp. Root1455]|uniref:M23 family metallopeptidase n=1 Tax=unclassified Caulobacter TaxID=2648921 RepID=UPI0006FC0526|nr:MULTISPECIES: M23 family metallopeptidase [unclassified Caulobacter]KQY28791.1 peptidase M24 [Caulobacter sp. Root487D2Y]KQY98948.1 peptidase M24 [Caulobacter sp. Root1455]